VPGSPIGRNPPPGSGPGAAARRPGLALGALLALALALCSTLSPGSLRALDRPNVLLFDATLNAARDFAVAAARERGWDVVDVSPDGATFEQTLDRDEEGRLIEAIRVHAQLAEENAGVRVYLQAERIESPNGVRDWTTDETAEFGDHLAKALDSLRAKWDRHLGRATSSAGDRTQVRDASQGAAPSAIGTWTYYAEGYARSLGCELEDSGASLAAAAGDWEHYRVPCRDGRVLRVRCRFGDCAGGK
jgi:hypothetical protein